VLEGSQGGRGRLAIVVLALALSAASESFRLIGAADNDGRFFNSS
jgi:hypothetical protein